MTRRFAIVLSAVIVAAVTMSLRRCEVEASIWPTFVQPSDGGVFVVKPYLQLGNPPAHRATRELSVLWQTPDLDAEWRVELRIKRDEPWQAAGAVEFNRVDMVGIPRHRVYRARLDLATCEGDFEYQIKRQGELVFNSNATAPRAPGSPYRFIAFGDSGVGSKPQKAIAIRALAAHPDFVLITGDIVYGRGLIAEYMRNFWPVYNADRVDLMQGAPLLRSTLVFAAPGNHDIAGRDLSKTPDGLAYYLYWDQPRNGSQGPWRTPLLGTDEQKRRFIDSTAGRYPGMACFSFDYANSHWTILDSDPNVDWEDPRVRQWLIQDLAAAQNATWKFVAFHHPGFNSSRAHFDDQRMRAIADVLENAGVDLVFNGHVHNYQRTYPLRYRTGPEGKPTSKGTWTLDRNFDGEQRTVADGVIYLVTGAGGNHLYDPEQEDNPGTWQSFTQKFISKTFSFTEVEVTGSKLVCRQIDAGGGELDRFTLSRSPRSSGG